MKVLHVISCLTIGGGQRVITTLLPKLNEQIDVTLLVYKRVNTKFEEDIINAGVKIISMDIDSLYNPRAVFAMKEIFKNLDIVHAHLFPTVYWASLAARGLNIKLVYTEHSTSNNRRSKPYLRPIERFIYSRFDSIISISPSTELALKKWIGADCSSFCTVCNGVNPSKFEINNSKVIPNSLIMVARFAPAKDQATIIRAMTMLDRNIILRLVGDGDSKKECVELAKELGVLDRVQFLGNRSDIPQLMNESYIGIQSSLWEGFGLTAVELMACKKPIIATNVDGLKQIVDGAGFLFEVGNAEQLAAQITSLIKDPKLYDTISAQCYERSKLYGADSMAQGYLNVYKQITSR